VPRPAVPTLTIIAGPNGAGKSTLSDSARIHGQVLVLDADALARRLRPDDPARAAPQAGREMIRRENAYLASRSSFAIETTLAGTGTLRLMERAREQGFTVHLLYIGVDTVETVLGRIEERVSRGGHGIPEPDVRRRYERSLRHLRPAIDRADRTTLIDNSTDQGPFEVLVLEKRQIVSRAMEMPRWVTTTVDELLIGGMDDLHG